MKPLRIIFTLLFALVIASCASQPPIDWSVSVELTKSLGTLDEGEWRADLDMLVANLESRHPLPWHAVTRADFLAALHSPIDPGLPPDKLARARWTRVMRALALLREGHTRLIENTIASGRLPLALMRLSDGYYVTAAVEGAPDLLGGRVCAVNDVPVEEAYRRLLPFISSENDGWAGIVFPSVLKNLELLKETGIVQEDASGARIEVDLDGVKAIRDVEAVLGDETPIEATSVFQARGIEPAETISRVEEFYWYRFLPESRTIVVQYNSCSERKDLPFAQFCDEVFSVIAREKPERLVLDLRNNAGGNSALFTFNFLPRIASSYLNRPGGIVVLIGPEVFSSGIFAVADMKHYTKAILAGQPTGQGYNHFGMTGYFMLPRSGLVIQHSTRYWELRSEDIGNSIPPDILIPTDAAAFLAGRDGVLEAVLGARLQP
jgi:hypothetical protein